MGLLGLALALAFAPTAPGGAATGGLEVTATPLPLLASSGPDAYGEANDINDRGVIAGGSGLRPVIWRRGAIIPLIESDPVPVGRALAVDNRGQVILELFGRPLTRWSRGSTTELDLGPDSQRWTLVDVNDRGQALIVRWATPSATFGIWQPDGSFTAIAPPAGYTASPVALSDAGHVIGNLTPIGEPGYRPFLWGHGRLTVLDDFGVARAVNRRGQVAGIALDGDRPSGGAVLWDHGEEIPLVPASTPVSYATDINDRGQVIGSMGSGPNQAHGFLWDDGELTEIPASSGPLLTPEQINERGQIVGRHVPDGSNFHAFLWDRGEMADLGVSFVPPALNDRGQAVGSLWGEDGSQPVLWEVARR